MAEIKKIIMRLIITALFTGAGVPAMAADVYLAAKSFSKTMPDGNSVLMWGFAEDSDNDLSTDGGETPTVPGPMITVAFSDSTLNIHVRNDLADPVSIIIPGQNAVLSPVRFFDSSGRQRLRSFTAETAPGQIGVYSWSGLKNGSYIYQSGTHSAVQVQMGLYGGLKKDAAASAAYTGNPRIDGTYATEVTLFYSEIDPALHSAVENNTYGTPAYPSTINYKPKYFLVNGEPYTGSIVPIVAGMRDTNILIRYFNAGLESHTMVIEGGYFKLIAEDGNPYPYAKELYSAYLPAGKTVDAILNSPRAATYTLYDRALSLLNGAASPGGLISHLSVGEPAGSPSVANDYFTVNEDTTLYSGIGQPGGVLVNDTLPGGGTLTAALESGPMNGTLTLNPDGSLMYTPAANFSGTDLFTYRASNSVTSGVATAQISVNPVNDAPQAVNDTASTVESVAKVIDVLMNDTDPDMDMLTVVSLTQGLNGSASVNADNTVTYTPAPGYTGNDSFTYMANDGSLNSNIATVNVTISPRTNAAPVAVDDRVTTALNTPITINVLANDSDSDGTLVPSSVTVTTQPLRGGTATVNPDGTINFTPRLNFLGTDGFAYTVMDNQGAVSNTAVVRVNVQ